MSSRPTTTSTIRSPDRAFTLLSLREISKTPMQIDTLDQPHVAALQTDAGMPFSGRLRIHTQCVHKEAERSGLIADLLHGRAARPDYAAYLANLLPVYERLEHHLAAGPSLAALRVFAAPALFRSAALRQDLAAIGGGGSPLPEARAYADAIDRAARGDGAPLLAHAYVRFLGDLSGGQILKPRLAHSLGLGPEALTFYDHPEIDDRVAYKLRLRSALDLVDASSSEAMRILDEAVAAFRHMIDLSLALARRQGRGSPALRPGVQS